MLRGTSCLYRDIAIDQKARPYNFAQLILKTGTKPVNDNKIRYFSHDLMKYAGY